MVAGRVVVDSVVCPLVRRRIFGASAFLAGTWMTSTEGAARIVSCGGRAFVVTVLVTVAVKTVLVVVPVVTVTIVVPEADVANQ